MTLANVGLIAASFTGIAVSLVPVAILSFGAFVKPLALTHGWGRGQTSLVFTLLSLAMAVAMPVAGRMIDKSGVRRPLIASLVLFPLCVAAMPAAMDRFGLAGLYTCAVLAGLAGAPSSSLAYVRVLAGRFTRRRGFALGVAMSGIAFGGAVWPQLATLGLALGGYHLGFYVLASGPLVIGLAVALALPVEAPRPAAAARVAVPDDADAEVAAALRSRLYWQLGAIFLLAALAIHSVQVHMIPLLADRGLSPETSANFSSVMFGCSLVARVGIGSLLDRYRPHIVGACTFLAGALGIALLFSTSGLPGVFVAAALLGLSAGAEVDLLAFLIGRFFGLGTFGRLYGILFGIFLVGSAVGPLLLGLSFDGNGSYHAGLKIAALALLASTALLWALPVSRDGRARAGGARATS